jgi:uncharacterized Rossmann fold enzyme
MRNRILYGLGEREKSMKSKVVIIVRGGVVQTVLAKDCSPEIEILDLDDLREDSGMTNAMLDEAVEEAMSDQGMVKIY